MTKEKLPTSCRIAIVSATLGALAWPLSASAQSEAEIYKLMPNTALSGVINPYMPDRASIAKAWPKTPKNGKNVQVGWTEITLGNPWFVELAKGAQRTAKSDGFSVDMQVADGDLQKQCAQIDTFITQRKDVIVVDPTDTLGVTNCINRAVNAGIPVVTIGTVPDSNARVLTTITPNPYANGCGAGQYIAKSAGKDTAIVAAMIIGVVGNSTSESRLDGTVGGMVFERMREIGMNPTKEDAMLRGFRLFESVKKTGKFDDPELKLKVVAMGEGHWTEAGGLAAAEDILSAHGDAINYIIADNDWMGLGALKAIRNINKAGTIKVAASADGSSVALKQVKEGNLLVTGTFSGEQTGVSAIAFLDQIFHHGLDPTDLPMGSYFQAHAITRENVDEFIDPNPDDKFYKFTVTPVLSVPQVKAAAKQS